MAVLGSASRRVSGKLALNRLMELVDRNFNGETPPRSRRGISRDWIAQRVGCERATLSSNRAMQRIIRDYEAKSRDTSKPSLKRDRKPEADNVVLLRPHSPDGEIVWALADIHGHTWDVPTLVWPDGVDGEVGDYLRHLRVKLKQEASSVEETAKKLRQFRRFLRQERSSIYFTDDNLLLKYQTSLSTAGVKKPRRNALLSAVHTFFKWLEETGRIRHRVQTGRRSDYADTMLEYEFPISACEVQYVTSRGRTRTTWVWPFIETGKGTKYERRHTPTYEEIEKIFAFTDVQKHGRRNVLIMTWALKTGARLSEILAVRKKDLPLTPQQQAKLNLDDQWVIKLKKRKRHPEGGVLKVPADLIWETLYYMRTERQEILSRKGGEDTQDIFLSERGASLIADSVTRICNLLFRAAKVYRANIHRLRARFAHNAVELVLFSLEEIGVTLDPSSGWHETALSTAAELMGHTSPRSLEPYLHDIVFKRSEEARHKSEKSAWRFNSSNPLLQEEILAAMTTAMRHIEQGETRKARPILRRVANDIDRQQLYMQAA
ncbi:site-specific integrase [Rhizobium ruizarguesonis]|uniref:tyrosine-type recombinase/integrase n=1 Tax=Rhizobium ruizarguesonis TaxID=2081791 RepID=UPI0010311BBB|nr:site-specific integrase [Rhizobium ruizarguesonis]TAW57583.1 site-specific integrase [Rhizobium ruizarguesonis]